eukprot:1159467-Pelagomonas_calceolata.AAC.12
MGTIAKQCALAQQQCASGALRAQRMKAREAHTSRAHAANQKVEPYTHTQHARAHTYLSVIHFIHADKAVLVLLDEPRHHDVAVAHNICTNSSTHE